jgi:hypothetical protein
MPVLLNPDVGSCLLDPGPSRVLDDDGGPLDEDVAVVEGRSGACTASGEKPMVGEETEEEELDDDEGKVELGAHV